MTAVKLKLPPGLYKNGTEYQAAGRWLDCDLIRWRNDNIHPLQGWQMRFDPATNLDLAPLWGDGAATEAVRSGGAIADGVGGINMFFGSNKKIYMLTNSNVVQDVTPAGWVAPGKDASFLSGYGKFRYSFSLYGTPRPTPQGIPPNVFSWGFAEWGFWAIAVARGIAGAKLKIKRTTDGRFVDIANSPAGTFDCVVTDERFVMTVGNLSDYRRVQWSDQENFDLWVPAIDNQAGGKTLAGIGKLVCCNKVLGNILIVGENDAFISSYVGPPYVYGFTRVGTRCGIIGPEAMCVTDTFAAWIGGKVFWMFDGTLRQLSCEVLDFYLTDHNVNQRSKTCGFTLSDFSECWWLYQSNESTTGEVDSYIVYNYAKKIWYRGRLDRTFGFDAESLIYPVMVSSSGYVYDHDVPGAGFEGRVPFIVSGPLELESGKKLLGMQYVYPDEQLDGDVRMELQCRGMPNSADFFARDFELLSPTSTHGIMGRDIRMKLYSAEINPSWRVGDFRVLPIVGSTPQR